MTDKDYGVSYIVSDEFNMPFEEIKNILIRQAAMNLLPEMIGSGNYHVLKFDIAKRQDYLRRGTEYALIIKSSIAQMRHVQMVSLEPVTYRGNEYSRVCLHCGNKLIYDKRGGCSACGAPNGGYR